MSILTGGRRPLSIPRPLLATLFAVAVAAVSATTTAAVLPHGSAVALAGPQSVHAQKTAVSLLSDYKPPGATSTVPLTVPSGGRATVPILLYHYIRTIDPRQSELGFNLSIDPKLFALQMALLHVEGAHPITLATLMDALAGKTGLPPHPVVLTFDDGYADFATAAEPVLSRFHFVGTNYVVSGFMDRPNYMTTAQVKQMDAAGMVIGAHTMHHVDLPHAGDARDEISGSKKALETLLGHPVLDFAYPYGFYNPSVQALVEEAGFRDATSTNWGTTQSLDERWVLPRLRVGGAPSLGSFASEAGLPAPTDAQRAQIQAEAQTDYQPPPDASSSSPPQGSGSGGGSSGGGSSGGGSSGGGSSGGGHSPPPATSPPAQSPPAQPPSQPCTLPPPLCKP